MSAPLALLSNEIFINDTFLAAGSGGEMEHIYPATGQVNGIVTLGGAAEIEQAVAAAREALPRWEALGPIGRRQALARLADVVERWRDQFEVFSAAEIGMPAASFAGRHAFAVEWIRMYQGWADKIGGELTATSDAGRLEYTRLEAYGVVGLVLTWNSPLLTLAMKVPAALAAGNTVVVKPSELTPYTALLFAKACVEAGIPQGVVNVVPGGVAAGEALVAHPHVEKISFTGGLKAATAMMKTGAPLIKPFCFELGGKSAHLVFEDADIATAVRILCLGLSNAGQSCTFGSRVYVHDSIFDAYRDQLLNHLKATVLGDPLSRSTTMGPLATAASRDRVLSMTATARERGEGVLLTGGRAPVLSGAFADGFFVEPTVFADVPRESALLREEIFGPVISLMRFGTEGEAIAAANDTDFGLANYVHTQDLRRSIRVTAQVKSGTVYCNDASRQNTAAPFGGYGRSGIGYEGGRPGLEEYLRRKTVGLA